MDADIRPRFEAWVKTAVPYLPLTRSDNFDYADPRTEVAWYAWLAASQGERDRVAACLI